MNMKHQSKKFVFIACLGQKLVFQAEVCEICAFYELKKLFESNQTQQKRSPLYIKSLSQNLCDVAKE